MREKNLNTHKKIHEQEKELFNCDKCEFSSAYKKIFCDKCDFSSAYKKSLNTHKKIHEQEKELFKCDKCEFSSTYKKSLKRHKIVHKQAEIQSLNLND